MKNVKYYNVLFPLWAILFFPSTWLWIVPGNFIIDSAVLLIAAALMKLGSVGKLYKSTILKVFLLGFLSDMVGAGLLFVFSFIFELGQMGDELYLTLPALLVSAGLIYVLEYYVSFRKQEQSVRRKLALTFAIATAPYMFLVPSAWLYGF